MGSTMPRDARLSDNDCGIFQSGFDSIPYKLADFSEKFAESSVAYNVKRFSVFFFCYFFVQQKFVFKFLWLEYSETCDGFFFNFTGTVRKYYGTFKDYYTRRYAQIKILTGRYCWQKKCEKIVSCITVHRCMIKKKAYK